MADNFEISFNKDDWRARFYIYCKGSFSEHKIFSIEESAIRVIPKFDDLFLLEVYTKKEKFKSVEHLLDHSFDVANEFLSTIATMTISPAKIVKFISLCPTEVSKNKPFEMILSEIDIETPNIPIENHLFKEIQKKINHSGKKDLILLLSKALNATAIDNKFLLYFTILDAIAISETNEKQIYYCDNCRHPTIGQLATSRFIKSIFNKHGIVDKDYNNIRKLRGKIAHGAGKRTEDFYDQLHFYLSKIEVVVIEEVTKRIDISPKVASKLYYSRPIWKIVGKKIGNRIWKVPARFRVISHEYHTQVSIGQVTNAKEENPENLFVTFGPPGSSTRPAIIPDAWPY